MRQTLYDFIIFLHQALDPFLHCQLFNTTRQNAAFGGVFLMPQYCSQRTACVRGSPGKPRECPVACRAPRTKTCMLVSTLKSFTNTVWHQIHKHNYVSVALGGALVEFI